MFEPSETELGQLSHVWTDSYYGQKAHFINKNVLVYTCGSSLKFLNTDTKETTTFLPPNLDNQDISNGICLLAVNSTLNTFAFSDTKLEQPRVYVYKYGSSIKKVSTLLDGASIEYLFVEFSNSDAILTVSGIPELQIIVWNWQNGERITSIVLNETLMQPECIKFSPLNWRQITVAYKQELHVWNLELFDNKKVKSTSKRFLLPPTNDNISELVVGAEFNEEFTYPYSAIASLDENHASVIDEVLDKRRRHTFKTLLWINNAEILVCTNENFLFKYSLADDSISLIHEPILKNSDLNDNEKIEDDASQILYNDNHITGLYLHRKALFVTLADQTVRLIDIRKLISTKTSNFTSDFILETQSDFISNLSFNTTYNALAICTNKGIQLTHLDKFKNSSTDEFVENFKFTDSFNARKKGYFSSELCVDYDYGKTVGTSCMSPYSDNFLVLKEHGCIQIWSNKEKRIVTRMTDITNQNCSCLAAHPGMQLAVVGTTNGSLIFMDLTNPFQPRVILTSNLHQKAVMILKFNSSGTILFSIGEDNKIFLIDTRLSSSVEKILVSLKQRLIQLSGQNDNFVPDFYTLGYIEYEGEAICMDTFDFHTDPNAAEESITTRVVIGIHDANLWDTVKKSVQEIHLVGDKQNSNQNSSTNSNYNHNLLVQTVQTQSTISRLDYANSSLKADYYCQNPQEKVKLCCKVLVFDFNFNVLKDDKNNVYSTLKYDIKDELLNKYTIHSQYLFSDLILTSRNYLVTFSDRFLTKFSIPENETKKNVNKLIYLELSDIIGTHNFGYGCLTKTHNNQFVASSGYDGLVQIRKANDLKTYTEANGPHYTNGGIMSISFHNDISNLIIVGYDNTISNFFWNCSNPLITRQIKLPNLNGDYEASQLQKYVAKPYNSEEKLTWYQLREKEFFQEQDNQYLPIKNDISKNLLDIGTKLKELLILNQSREDLAKLKEHEFYLDTEELDRLQKECETEMLKIRDKTEFENLAKLYVKEIIKKECWDNMKVKGRGIQAFNTNLLVENYAIKEQSQEELRYLTRIKALRKIEIFTKKVSGDLSAETMNRENIHELIEFDDDEKENDYLSKNQVTNSYLSPNLTQLGFKGSIGALFNGDSSLFYHQFELFTREQKMMQITLLQEAIYNIKENFNKEFELIMQRKNQEIAKIKEKNTRLKQIYMDLNETKQLVEPKFGDAENPEILFEVRDEEVTVEKYLAPEQQKLLDDRLAEKARKRELEKLDNWRERGLLDMMNGVLQIRREDELKKDIPIPQFAIEKKPEEWTLDEVKQYQIYEQKVKELNEEREKLRKQLMAEIVKINEQILEYYQNFDNQLFGLHQRKVKTHQAIFQEELKIVRLFNSILVDSELETYENQLNAKLDKIKEQRKDFGQDLTAIKKMLEAYKEEYEILSAEDKSQDKAFIREFSDVPAGARDQLLKLFKKRAKPRGIINKTSLNPTLLNIPELGENNPFFDRPSTSTQIHFYETDTETILRDLDHFDNAPGAVDKPVWDRFVAYRRDKIKMENNLRNKGLNLNEMILYHQKRIEEDDQTKKSIDEHSKKISLLQDLRLRAFNNLQVQLLLKQGQVEFESGPFVHDVKNCLLLNREVVESLNNIILTHGKQKISIMVDCKNFRSGITQLEWEHRKMKMTIEDYIQKQRDITYLKLTREAQEYLSSVDYDGKKQKEISVLELTLEFQAKTHERVYGQKSRKLNEIKKFAVKIANNSDQLNDRLIENNVILHERKFIGDEITGKSIDIIRDERFQQILQRRRLVDLAKAQAQEVAFLRSEVERLRMKTFPALVQIEF